MSVSYVEEGEHSYRVDEGVDCGRPSRLSPRILNNRCQWGTGRRNICKVKIMPSTSPCTSPFTAVWTCWEMLELSVILDHKVEIKCCGWQINTKWKEVQIEGSYSKAISRGRKMSSGVSGRLNKLSTPIRLSKLSTSSFSYWFSFCYTKQLPQNKSKKEHHNKTNFKCLYYLLRTMVF